MTIGRIFRFWSPLASTWVMMSVEGPLVAAVIARLPHPKVNLAAFGIALAVAMLVEAPIINMMAAATAVVKDPVSYRKLRIYTYMLNGGISTVMLVAGATPAFVILGRDWLGMPADVVVEARWAILLFLPWPAAIGFRRFFQGVLIAGGRTQRVAFGTLLRLIAMATAAVGLPSVCDLPGAWIGALALSTGVMVESLAVRIMASPTIRELDIHPVSEDSEAWTTVSLTRFYYPLGVTSVMVMAVHPMVTFLAGLGPSPLESLAVLPVVNALVFIFRSFGLSYQEVAIALMGTRWEYRRILGRFALTMAIATSAGLSLLAFTPLSQWWFQGVSGLSPELASFARWPAAVMALMPALSVLIVWQRAMLVYARDTGAITWASVIEVAVIVSVMLIGMFAGHLNGALAATVGYMLGRFSACFYLSRHASPK